MTDLSNIHVDLPKADTRDNGRGVWLLDGDRSNTWAWAEDRFTVEELEKIINLGESLFPEEATVGAPDEGRVDLALRPSWTSWINTTPDNAWIFRRLVDVVQWANERFFGFELGGFYEGLQFTRYDAPGDRYGAHVDRTGQGIARKLSITMQLSDPASYQGGDLVLRPNGVEEPMTRERGHIVLFPSWTVHEVKPVTSGRRYSLVAWVSGPPFR